MEGEGAPSASSAPDSLVLPRSGGFRSGDRLPSRKCCPRKTALPRAGARNHAKVEQVVLFQVDRKHRQEFRQFSFPFLERTFTGSPSEYKRFPPTGEKPQDPWGPSQAKPGLCSSRDESRPHLKYKTLRERTGGCKLWYHNSCGTRD